ncbi:MAG: phosphatidylserine/phosphatidylglycerophosphate/cardiolipin synthase family protein [Oligoflexia bacterium]|nr:phosphatidylserine/phosphatidylglycerophosphate/cardiolipin synthase family protein [Oligoflexia bacterium]
MHYKKNSNRLKLTGSLLLLSFAICSYSNNVFSSAKATKKMEIKLNAINKEIDSLNKKIVKIQKRLDYQDSYKVAFSKSKLKIVRNILPADCAISVSGKILDSKNEDKGAIKGSTSYGYIDLTDSINSLRKKNSKFGLILSINSLNLIYEKEKEINKDLEAIVNLNKLCMQRADLKQQKEVLTKKDSPCLNESDSSSSSSHSAGSVLKLHEDGIKIFEYSALGSRPIHYKNISDKNSKSAIDDYGLGDENIQVAQLGGQQSFVERMNLIKNAKKSIKLQTIHFMGDESGMLMADLLIKKKREGVNVKIILDSMLALMDIRNLTGRKNSTIMYDNLMAAGIPVLGHDCGSIGHQVGDELKKADEYANSSWLQVFSPFRDGKFKEFMKHFFENRKHEKIMTVDGKSAIMGGMNIANDYFRVSPPGQRYWRDQDVLITIDDKTAKAQKVPTNIIQDIDNIIDGDFATYEGNYLAIDKEKKALKCLNPHKVGTKAYENFLKKHTKKYQDAALNVVMEKIAKKENKPELLKEHYEHFEKKKTATFFKRIFGKKNTFHEKESTYKTIEQLKTGKIDGQLFKPIMHEVSEAQIVQQRPAINELNIEQSHLDIINQAKKELLIANPYFIPSEQIKDALNKAAKRGVKIKILVNSEITNDTPVITSLARYYYKDILDQNVGGDSEIEIYEWDGTDKRVSNAKQTQGMIHAKFIIADRQAGIIGSYNLDQMSREIQSESIIAIKSKGLAMEMTKQFYDVDLKFAKKVSYDEALQYRKPRGHTWKAFTHKLKVAIAKKISPIL